MTRKKVTLAYITNDSERKASYKKRKKGLIKKVSELSTLCGVETCAIIYSQYDPVPVVWPSREGAEAVLARFWRLSEMDQARKMVNQETFTRQRIKKSDDQLRRLRKDNNRSHLEGYMFQCIGRVSTLDYFDLREAAEMGLVVNQILRDIHSRMEIVWPSQAPPAVEAAPPPPPPPPPPPEAAEHNMDSFPWNLVQSPAGVGLGWDDDGMVLPYPYIFNHDDNNASPSGRPGNGTN